MSNQVILCDVCDNDALDGWNGTVVFIDPCGCKARVCAEHGLPGNPPQIDILHKQKYHPDKQIIPRASELEYLKWFRINADFGPADGDVKDEMDRRFMLETGKNLPEGWNFASDGETSLDVQA